MRETSDVALLGQATLASSGIGIVLDERRGMFGVVRSGEGRYSLFRGIESCCYNDVRAKSTLDRLDEPLSALRLEASYASLMVYR